MCETGYRYGCGNQTPPCNNAGCGVGNNGYGCMPIAAGNGNMYGISSVFDGIRNTPQLIACLKVDSPSSDRILVGVTVNYMAIPEGITGTPVATFIVTYDDGCCENELRRYSQTATGYCYPQLAAFSFFESAGAGIYRVYAVLEECVMNTPQNPGSVDLYVLMADLR